MAITISIMFISMILGFDSLLVFEVAYSVLSWQSDLLVMTCFQRGMLGDFVRASPGVLNVKATTVETSNTQIRRRIRCQYSQEHL